MEIPIEVAYAKACQALGESMVRERLLMDLLQQKDQIIKIFQERVEADVAKSVIEEATGIVEEVPDAVSNNGNGRLQQNDKASGETSS